jgi:hypothetical protein
MSSGVYQPYIFVKKEQKPLIDENATTDSDRKIFSVIDHLMGTQRKWGGINDGLILSDGSGRIPGLGSAGMAPEELRVRKFMESCTFKAMISCAGGTFLYSIETTKVLRIFFFFLIFFSQRFCIGYWSWCIYSEY